MRWVTVHTGPNLVPNAAFGLHFRALVSENATLEPPLNGAPGQRILIRLEWTASATVTMHAEWALRGSFPLPTASGSVVLMEAVYDHVAGAWERMGVVDLSSVYDPAGTAAAAILVHEAASNPHPVYLTQPEADVLYAAATHATRHAPGGADQLFARGAAIADATADLAVLENRVNLILARMRADTPIIAT